MVKKFLSIFFPENITSCQLFYISQKVTFSDANQERELARCYGVSSALHYKTKVPGRSFFCGLFFLFLFLNTFSQEFDPVIHSDENKIARNHFPAPVITEVEAGLYKDTQESWIESTPDTQKRILFNDKSTLIITKAKKIEPASPSFVYHAHEQTVFIKKGRLQAIVDGKNYFASVNDVLVIPSNIAYSLLPASSEVEYLQFFTPTREDLRPHVSSSVFEPDSQLVFEQGGREQSTVAGGALVYFQEKFCMIGGGEKDGASAKMNCFDPILKKQEIYPSMNLERMGHKAIAYKNGILVFGGMQMNGEGKIRYLDLIEFYNPATRKWEIFGKLPMELSWFSCAVMDQTLWIAGGSNQEHRTTDRVFTFDLKTKIWKFQKALPQALTRSVMVAHENQLYLIGGETSDSSASNQVYILEKDGFLPHSKMNFQRKNPAVVIFCNQIFVLGGWFLKNFSPFWPTQVEKLNHQTWQIAGDLVHGRDRLQAVSFRGKIYVFGGMNHSVVPFFEEGSYKRQKSLWKVDSQMSLQLAYQHPQRAMLMSSEVITPKSLNYVNSFSADITNIEIPSLYKLGISLPPRQPDEDMWHLKFYEYPSHLDPFISFSSFFFPMMISQLGSWNQIETILKDKKKIHIKKGEPATRSRKYFKEAPFPPLLIPTKEVKLLSRSLTPQQWLDSGVQFASLYLSPSETLYTSDPDTKAKDSTRGVLNFHAELLSLYEKTIQEIKGPQDWRVFVNTERCTYPSSSCTIDRLSIMKNPLVFTDFRNFPMPKNPSLYLSSLLIVKLEEFEVRKEDLLFSLTSQKFEQRARKKSDRILEVASVIRLD